MRTCRFGNGVFAKAKIHTGETIASFDGKIYENDSTEWDDPTLHDYLADHVIQFAPKRWRHSNGIAIMVNHSCEPNCGIKNLFDIVAMRDVASGEEINWDYEMAENSDKWRMQCQCNNPACRKLIGKFDNLPKELKKKYEGFISEWLLKS